MKDLFNINRTPVITFCVLQQDSIAEVQLTITYEWHSNVPISTE